MQILDKNCSFVPKNVNLVLKNQKNCTFYSIIGIFAKKFHKNVQILDKKCSFCTQKCTFSPPEKQKNCTFYTKNEVFAKIFH